MLNLREIHKNNLTKIFNQIGVSVSYGSYITNGFLNREPTEVLSLTDKNYAVSSNELILIIVTDSIGTITNHTDITVDSVIYSIDRFIKLSDGAETKLWIVSK